MQHTLANYINICMDNSSTYFPKLSGSTHRQRFLYHLHRYNSTQSPRERFYLLNLAVDDIRYLESLDGGAEKVEREKVTEAKLLFASDGCTDRGSAMENLEAEKDFDKAFGAAIDKCLEGMRTVPIVLRDHISGATGALNKARPDSIAINGCDVSGFKKKTIQEGDNE